MKAPPKPAGMTKGGDEKNKIGDGYGEQEKERDRERSNGIFAKWNKEIKGFSLIDDGQQIIDLFDRVYIVTRQTELNSLHMDAITK